MTHARDKAENLQYFRGPNAKIYGCEAWTLKTADKQRIATVEMRFIRKTVGYTLLDKPRNADIMNELRATPILSKSRNYWRRWRAHMDRMNEERRSPKACSRVHADQKEIEGKTEKEVGGYISNSSSSNATTPQTGQYANRINGNGDDDVLNKIRLPVRFTQI